MKLKELILNYVNQPGKERKVGRYWASDTYAILTGQLKTKDFLKKRRISLTGASHILRGEEKEATLKKILEQGGIRFKHHDKKEIKINGFVLVAEADFIVAKRVLEVKSPMFFGGEIKKYHYPQLEAQYRIFNKPVYVGYINEWRNAVFYKYPPSDKLWQLIQDKLKEFHQALLLYEGKDNKKTRNNRNTE